MDLDIHNKSFLFSDSVVSTLQNMEENWAFEDSIKLPQTFCVQQHHLICDQRVKQDSEEA